MKIIYGLKNGIGDTYVGCTGRLRARFREHRCKLRHKRHAMQFSDWDPDDLSIEILEVVDDKIAVEREQFWIEQLSAINVMNADQTHTAASRKLLKVTRLDTSAYKGPKPPHVIAALRRALKTARQDPEWANRMRWKNRKLSPADIQEIRTNPQNLTYKNLGEKFGCSAASICLIRKRRRYAEV